MTTIMSLCLPLTFKNFLGHPNLVATRFNEIQKNFSNWGHDSRFKNSHLIFCNVDVQGKINWAITIM